MMSDKMKAAMGEALDRLNKMTPEEFYEQALAHSADPSLPTGFLFGHVSHDDVFFPDTPDQELIAVYENAHGAYGTAEEFHKAIMHVLQGGKAKDTVRASQTPKPIEVPTSPLAGRIMRTQVGGLVQYDMFGSKVEAYKTGHLHARQAAANLALMETDKLTQQLFMLEKKWRHINADRIWWIEECGRRRAVTDFILGQVRAAIEALSADIEIRGGVVNMGDYHDDASVILESDFQSWVSKAMGVLCVATADIRPVTSVDDLFTDTPPEEYEKVLLDGIQLCSEEFGDGKPSDPFPPTHEWYQWSGGACPVHEDVFVAYRLRALGETHGWDRAGELDWAHHQSGADIMSFAVWPGHLEQAQ